MNVLCRVMLLIIEKQKNRVVVFVVGRRVRASRALRDRQSSIPPEKKRKIFAFHFAIVIAYWFFSVCACLPHSHSHRFARKCWWFTVPKKIEVETILLFNLTVESEQNYSPFIVVKWMQLFSILRLQTTSLTNMNDSLSLLLMAFYLMVWNEVSIEGVRIACT